MSHSQDSDDRGTPDQEKTDAPTKEQNAASVSGWTDPAYSVGLGSFKHLFFDRKEQQQPLQYDFSAPGTAQPNTVPSPNNPTTKNQTGETANDAGQIMNNNSNTNNAPNNQPSNVGQVETESHGRRDIVFSQNFKFKPTLLSIFWKIDKDDDQRLSKSELSDAMSNGSFHDDEELILCLLWRHFDDIRRRKIMSSTFFDRRGISIEEIEAFEGWSRYLPQNAINNSMSTAPKAFRKPSSFIRPHGQ
ncbi:MAG TPA: hypothetical protein V6C69_08610 [Trichormus sp.]|jgi:hypothetical protein